MKPAKPPKVPSLEDFKARMIKSGSNCRVCISPLLPQIREAHEAGVPIAAIARTMKDFDASDVTEASLQGHFRNNHEKA